MEKNTVKCISQHSFHIGSVPLRMFQILALPTPELVRVLRIGNTGDLDSAFVFVEFTHRENPCSFESCQRNALAATTRALGKCGKKP